jgi:hypothetical protein
MKYKIKEYYIYICNMQKKKNNKQVAKVKKKQEKDS